MSMKDEISSSRTSAAVRITELKGFLYIKTSAIHYVISRILSIEQSFVSLSISFWNICRINTWFVAVLLWHNQILLYQIFRKSAWARTYARKPNCFKQIVHQYSSHHMPVSKTALFHILIVSEVLISWHVCCLRGRNHDQQTQKNWFRDQSRCSSPFCYFCL